MVILAKPIRMNHYRLAVIFIRIFDFYLEIHLLYFLNYIINLVINLNYCLNLFSLISNLHFLKVAPYSKALKIFHFMNFSCHSNFSSIFLFSKLNLFLYLFMLLIYSQFLYYYYLIFVTLDYLIILQLNFFDLNGIILFYLIFVLF